jgi:hypothetical protein
VFPQILAGVAEHEASMISETVNLSPEPLCLFQPFELFDGDARQIKIGRVSAVHEGKGDGLAIRETALIW